MFSCLSALISQFKQKQFYEILNDLHKTHFDVEQQVIQLEISAELYVPCYMYSHLSPGVSLIYDLAHDSGMLQSELFTSRNQNLVLAKLPNSGFWRYGQFFK